MTIVTKLPFKFFHLHRAYSNYFTPETLLSKENIEKTIKRLSNINMKLEKANLRIPMRNAAVLVPICVVDNEVSLVYTLRAADLKTHRGQVSFPGGMQDSSDISLEQTALRETEEELGVQQEKIQIWGTGNTIISRNTLHITPVVGLINCSNILNELNVNPAEVKEVFTVSVQTLCDLDMIRHTQFKTGYSIPVFTGGKRRIWGLTAVLTHVFLKAFVSREAYPYNIKFVPFLKGSRSTSFL